MKTGYVFKHIVGSLLFFAILFLSAGKFNYWQGLVYLVIGMLMMLLNYTVFRIDPELLRERANPEQGTKSWDKAILGLTFLGTIAMYVMAGLDSGRFHWSPRFPIIVSLSGIILTIAGQLLFLIAQKQNRFFSSTVRVQKERKHTVCDKGLYTFVRHPAYLGFIVQLIGFPMLFGSLWSIIPVSVSIVLFLMRTWLEDKTLREELPGYAEYTKKTRFRIIPGAW
jgi:protein-S-isoprenylcysteine O-methyltransferase Ste14